MQYARMLGKAQTELITEILQGLDAGTVEAKLHVGLDGWFLGKLAHDNLRSGKGFVEPPLNYRDESFHFLTRAGGDDGLRVVARVILIHDGVVVDRGEASTDEPVHAADGRVFAQQGFDRLDFGPGALDGSFRREPELQVETCRDRRAGKTDFRGFETRRSRQREAARRAQASRWGRANPGRDRAWSLARTARSRHRSSNHERFLASGRASANHPARAGMMVIASANEAIRARMTLPPMEPTKSPTLPGMSTMGAKASTVVTVEASSGTKRCCTDAETASAGESPRSRCFFTSSTTTMALSMRRPSATTIPKIEI